MDALGIFKFWRNTNAGADVSSEVDDARNSSFGGTDDDDSLFDLAFKSLDRGAAAEKRDEDLKKDSRFIDSPRDVFLSKNDFSSPKPQSPVNILRSTPKFKVFILGFKKSSKCVKSESSAASPVNKLSRPSKLERSNRFSLKIRPAETAVGPVFARDNSLRSKMFKENCDVVSEMSRHPTTESPEAALKFTVSSSRDKEYMGLSEGSTKPKPFDFLGVLYGICHMGGSAENAVSGAAAGGLVETVKYPVDTIKTRLQAGYVVRGGGKIVFKGLYSGLAGNLVGVIPASALFIGVNEPTKQKLLKIFPENLSAVAHLAAGVVGGAASSIVQVIKQRIQIGHFASAPDAVRLIVSKEGFRGLYAGYGSFLLRDLPFDAIQFCIYEQLRAARRDLNDPKNAMIGAFADSTMEEAYKNYDVVFYEDTIYTTITADPNIVSDWISAIMHFHRYKLYNLVVGLDVEWRPSCNSVQKPAVATIQICIGNCCLIYQIIYSTNRFPQSLIDFLSNDDFTFVGVDVQSDFNALKTDYEMTCNPRAVVLRMLATSALGRADLNQAGLKTLAGLVLGKEVDT
ncbi:hypothetical protein CASFOL_000772 [Castilleja foliolosa]|uniref:3'-5' exonuclease domain-containing protein n=1 Tax=Castilleja foliolosa TaxID=1961234 RepID=A0ABD3ENY2_9LAMI